jgi:tetratricopeptide (TPR) repeat protein
VAIEAAESFDTLIAQGIACRERGEFSQAIEYISRACELQPDSLGALCERAYTQLKSGAFAQAQADYVQACDRDPTNVDALAGLGQVCIERGKLPMALRYLRQAAELAPARRSLRCDLAATLRELKRYDEAREVLRSILAEVPDELSALVGLGLIARAREDHVAAAAFFRQALARHAPHAGLQLELAHSLRSAQLGTAAADVYREILEADPQCAAAHAGLAMALRDTGDAAAALAQWRVGTARIPTDPALHVGLADILRELGALEEAESHYRIVLKSQSQSAPAHIGLGLIARQRGDHGTALEHLQRAAAIDAAHLGLRCELALTLKELGRLQESEQTCLHAAALNPRAPGPKQILSAIASARGQLAEAVELVEAACQLDPTNMDAQLQLAAALRDTNRCEEALAIVERCLAATPNHPGACIEWGLLRRAADDHQGALGAFLRAAALNSEHGAIEVAAEYVALGDPAAARSAYEQALRSRPHSAGALLGLAELDALAADYEHCAVRCDELIARYPHRLEAYRLKCRALIHLERSDEARSLAAALSHLVPSAPAAAADALNLEVLRTCGERERASVVLAQPRVAATKEFDLWLERALTYVTFCDFENAEALLHDPPASRIYEQSRVQYVRGLLADARWQVGEAIACFDEALRLHPNDAGAHDHLARLHLLQGEPDATRSHLRQMLKRNTSALALRGESLSISQTLTGHLLNELSLDRELLELLPALRNVDMLERIERLMSAVRANGNITLRAVYLMLALRQSGFLQAHAAADSTEVCAIPKRIMQFWDQPEPPPGIARLMTGWAEAHPDFEYRKFDNQGARRYLAEHYPEEVLRAYRRVWHPAQASDLFRLAYLLREGGFYVDADDRCVGNLCSLLAAPTAFIAAQEQYATIGNNFLGCAPRDAAIQSALESAVEGLNRGDSDNIWLATGPGLLTRCLAKSFTDETSDSRGWFQHRIVLDRPNILQILSPHQIAAYKRTFKSWSFASHGRRFVQCLKTGTTK